LFFFGRPQRGGGHATPGGERWRTSTLCTLRRSWRVVRQRGTWFRSAAAALWRVDVTYHSLALISTAVAWRGRQLTSGKEFDIQGSIDVRGASDIPETDREPRRSVRWRCRRGAFCSKRPTGDIERWRQTHRKGGGGRFLHDVLCARRQLKPRRGQLYWEGTALCRVLEQPPAAL
jgi:hypothetical protein